MSAEPREDPVEELVELARALRAHAEWQASTGATGLARASEELRAERAGSAMPVEPAGPVQAPVLASEPAARRSAPPVDAPTPRQVAAPAPPAEAPAPPAEAPAPPAEAPAPPAEAPAPPPVAASSPADAPASEPAVLRPAPPVDVPARAAAAPSVSVPASRPSPGEAASAVADQDVARRLELLATEVTTCTRCPLHETRTQTVFARGTAASGLCFIGEGPGADEDAQGYPFVGKAGQLLDRMITAMGFGRDEVYVCNIVKCRPPNNRKPTPEEMAACMPYLEQQLELIQPTVLVALGATAVQGLLGTTAGITRLRGKWKLYKGKIAMMPTFHPAYLLRTPRAKREVWEDLQAVLRQMGRQIPSR